MRKPVIALLVLAACGNELNVPAAASIACDDTNSCPVDLICFNRRCVPQSQSRAPALGLATPERSQGSIALVVTAFDSESEPATLAVEVLTVPDLGVTVAADARGDLVPVSPSTLETSPGGQTTTVLLDAATFFADRSRRILAVRITAEDDDGIGDPVYSRPFVFGNTPPSVTISESTRASLATPQAGDVFLQYTVSDDDQDPAEIRLEYRISSDTLWLPGVIRAGSVAGLDSSGTIEQLLVWDTARSPELGDYDDTLDAIRLIASDTPQGSSPADGPPAEISTVAIRNRNAPRVLSIRAPRAEVGVSDSPIPIAYIVADEERSAVDIRFEYSFDNGTTWNDCQEYVDVFSEGRSALTTSPDGIAHIFTWDPSGVRLTPGAVLIRLGVIEVGATPGSTTATLPLLQTVGPLGPDGSTRFVEEVSRVGHSDVPFMALGKISVAEDFNEDGVVDTAVYLEEFGADAAGVGVYLAVSASPGVGSGSFTPGPYLSVGSRDRGFRPEASLAVGDLDGDLHADLVALSTQENTTTSMDESTLFIFWGDGTGAFPSTTELDIASRIDAVAVGEFDGDTAQEVYFLSNLRLNIMDASSTRELTSVFDDEFSSNATQMVVADFDGNGRDDVATNDIRVLLHDGTNGFGEPFSFPVDGDNRGGLTSTDLNRDGFDDLVAQVVDGSALRVFFGRDDPALPLELDATYPVESGQSNNRDNTQIAAGDVNGDTLIDVIDGRGALFLGLRNGGATGRLQPALDIGEKALLSLTLADANSDGLDDVLISNGSTLIVLEATRGNSYEANRLGLGTRTRLDNFPVLSGNGVRLNGRVFDINADGRADFLIGGLGAALGDGPLFLNSTAFQSRAFDANSLDRGSDEALVILDADGDGVEELMDIGQDPVLLYTRAHIASVDWTVSELDLGEFTSDDGTAADFNGDGFDDLLLATNRGTRVFISLGADGGFELPGVQLALADGFKVSVADLDADGASDAIYSNQASENDHFFGCFGVGDGTFESPCLELGGSNNTVQLLTIDDLNADGILDIFAAQGATRGWLGQRDAGGPNRNYISQGNSFGNRRSAALNRTPSGTFSVNRSEINLLVSTQPELVDGRVTIGAGEEIQVVAEGVTGLRSLTGVDLNRDGLPDIVALDSVGQQVVTFVGQQSAFVESPQVIAPLSSTIPSVGSALVNVDLEPATGQTADASALQTLVVRRYLDTAGPDSFSRGLIESVLADSVVLEPLSPAFQVGGLTHLRRDDGLAAPGGPRLSVHSRFGRLDPSSDPPSGIVVELPLYGWVDSAELASGTVRLVRRERSWVYSEDFPADPSGSSLADRQALPRFSEAGEFRDVYRERYSWSAVPVEVGGDLTIGSGERAVVVERLEAQVARLFVVRDGVYQVVRE
ncbi:MAG: VCBS repeat-containing protein [Myxococcota bacterium]